MEMGVILAIGGAVRIVDSRYVVLRIRCFQKLIKGEKEQCVIKTNQRTIIKKADY